MSEPIPTWTVWFNRRGRVKGVGIVFRASDYQLEFHCPYLTEADRVAACQRLADQLNAAKVRV